MAITPKYGWEFFDEHEPSWYPLFVSLVESIDAKCYDIEMGMRKLASDPEGLGEAEAGCTWFNTTTNHYRGWNGTNYVDFDGGGGGGGGGPLFHVGKNGPQPIPLDTPTKVTWQDTVFVDPDHVFDFLYHRFFPLIAGKYLIHAQVEIKRGDDNLFDASLSIYKRGQPYQGGSHIMEGIVNANSGSITSLLDLDGANDYVELFVTNKATGTARPTVEEDSWFIGYRVGS